MPTTQEILAVIKEVLDILRADNTMPLTHPLPTPAGRAHYMLAALYTALLMEYRAYE
jgi:hypothetical protein